jgi:DNA invertase Pin-like site-specific DNA recombinase
MATYGYARVSSTSQSTAIQEATLKNAGCNVVRSEKVSGASRKGRDELQTILDFIQSGDVLVVCKLDRLGRSTRDVLNLVHELDEKGASLRVLEPSIDTSGPMGRMVLTVLGMVSEMELSFIKERQKAGIEKAKSEGKFKGRRASINKDRIIQLKSEGITPTEIAKAMGIGRASVYRILEQDSP